MTSSVTLINFKIKDYTSTKGQILALQSYNEWINNILILNFCGTHKLISCAEIKSITYSGDTATYSVTPLMQSNFDVIHQLGQIKIINTT